MRNNTNSKMLKSGNRLFVGKKGMIIREFVGDDSLNEILTPLLETQIDKLVESFYHTTQANQVTSQITQSEGEDA